MARNVYHCSLAMTIVLGASLATTRFLQARRADIASAGVEGPGCVAPLNRIRPGGSTHDGSITCKRLNWYISPLGLALHGVDAYRWFTQPA